MLEFRCMSKAKHHHYVPRFYLSRFVHEDGFLWAYDKVSDHMFLTTPNNIARENNFYDVSDLIPPGEDGLLMEKQLAQIESEASKIMECWLHQVQQNREIVIPTVNREIMSLFLALQLLRTAEAREQLVQFAKATQSGAQMYDPRQDAQRLHTCFLWDENLVETYAQKFRECIWIFAHNNSDRPFYTSDHPVQIKSSENIWQLWPQAVFQRGMYTVFPLTPDWILYCKEPLYWKAVARFDQSVSPVTFTPEMVDHENFGQIGLSWRFVFGCERLGTARKFCELHPAARDPGRNRFELPPHRSDEGTT